MAIKRRCAETIVDVLPQRIAARYFDVSASGSGDGADQGKQEKLVEQAESLLDVLGDAYMNKHLLFGILELVVVRLVPEMAERGVQALISERLGDRDQDLET